MEQDTLNHHLYQEHEKHYSQAQGSPGMVHPISTLLGPDTNMQFGEVFSRGLVNIDKFPGIKQLQKIFFKDLQHTHNNPPYLEGEMTVESVPEGFKIWKERTSTSPSG
eukprot:13297531-Ditylum_brightwellii.AAC.1